MTAFFSELVSYLIKFIFLFAVSIGGAYFGVSRAKKKKSKEQA